MRQALWSKKQWRNPQRLQDVFFRQNLTFSSVSSLSEGPMTSLNVLYAGNNGSNVTGKFVYEKAGYRIEFDVRVHGAYLLLAVPVWIRTFRSEVH